MTAVEKTNEDLNLVESSFKFHNFNDQVGEVKLYCQIVKMENSLYLWVSDYNEQNMNDLSLAFTMDSEMKKSSVSTKIMGPIADQTSSNIASRLSKKTGKPIFVSFNVTADNLTMPNLERRIHEEFKLHPELLAF